MLGGSWTEDHFLGTGCPLWDERVCSGCLGGEGRCGAGGRSRRRDQAREQGLGKDTGSPCILELASRQPIGQPRLGGIISGGANPRAQPSRRSGLSGALVCGSS